MESSLRVKTLIDGAKTGEETNNSSNSEDRFSIDKCFACIQIGIQKHGLTQF